MVHQSNLYQSLLDRLLGERKAERMQKHKELTKKQKKFIRLEILKQLDSSCNDCKIYLNAKKEHGIDEASRYCITECEIGLRLQKLSSHLGKNEQKTTITKEMYLELKNQGLNNRSIAEQFDIPLKKIHSLRINWGLTEKRKKSHVSS